jgi:hypothetical protein
VRESKPPGPKNWWSVAREISCGTADWDGEDTESL